MVSEACWGVEKRVRSERVRLDVARYRGTVFKVLRIGDFDLAYLHIDP